MTAALVGWTPIRIDGRDRTASVDWCFTDGMPFTDPVFDQSVERCLREPFRLLFRHRTGFDELHEYARGHPGLAPAGFVFHMSRCGSTLLSQMLAAVDTNLVIAEAPPVDAVLRMPASSGERVGILRDLLAALGQRRAPAQQHLVVKFDAWHTLEMTLVREAFPEVPFVFLYRDPVEVLVSHERQRGAHMIPGVLPPAFFGWDETDVATMTMTEYGARVVARICDAALERRDDDRVAFVNYRDLRDYTLATLPTAWRLDCSRDATTAMCAAAERDAKNPAIAFEPDSATKQAAASPEVRACARAWLDAPYRQLEAAAR